MRIYVIGGKARSGKDTLGNLLKEELIKYNYKPCTIRITEPLYNYARRYFNWNEEKDKKPREFLQQMGIEIIKEKLGKKDFLLNRLYEDIEILSNFFDTFIITDARLVDEFISIKSKYSNITTIKLERNNYDNDLTDKERSHITEQDIDNYKDFDYIIENSEIEKLKEQVIEIVRKEESNRGEIL